MTEPGDLVFGSPETAQEFAPVGYSHQLRIIPGIVKLLGAIVLVVPGFANLKALHPQLPSASPPALKDRYETLRTFIEALGDDIQSKQLKNYIASRRLKNFACVGVRAPIRNHSGLRET